MDYQIRSLLHLQKFSGENSKVGFTFWWSDVDWTADTGFRPSLLVGGLLVGDKTNWIEFMAGGLVHREPDGSTGFDPGINVRMSGSLHPRVSLFADLEYFFRNDRFYAWVSLDTPVAIGGYEFKVGIESESIVFRSPERGSSYGFGPHVVFPIPVIPGKLTLVLNSAYQFRNDGDWFRNYVVANVNF